ncbi:hypothetical protein HZH66_007899 [Vespula vulgaris]|uniref:Uncharacterized protein n=1 Tax=Vespula vulgaris TaxID=7454 RepID=A0A834N2V8_VESVU|nr:hypothetical protein HZH66_007899 [Vespula vulgaris]
MGKTTLIVSLILSIVIVMASSLDSSEELEFFRSIPKVSWKSKIYDDAKPPELVVYLLKRMSKGNLGKSSGNENSNTDNIDCQCKCGIKKNNGLSDIVVGYNDNLMGTHGSIISEPKRKKSFSCAPDSFWDGSKCAQII